MSRINSKHVKITISALISALFKVIPPLSLLSFNKTESFCIVIFSKAATRHCEASTVVRWLHLISYEDVLYSSFNRQFSLPERSVLIRKSKNYVAFVVILLINMRT